MVFTKLLRCDENTQPVPDDQVLSVQRPHGFFPGEFASAVSTDWIGCVVLGVGRLLLSVEHVVR